MYFTALNLPQICTLPICLMPISIYFSSNVFHKSNLKILNSIQFITFIHREILISWKLMIFIYIVWALYRHNRKPPKVCPRPRSKQCIQTIRSESYDPIGSIRSDLKRAAPLRIWGLVARRTTFFSIFLLCGASSPKRRFRPGG